MPTPKVNSWLGWRIFTVNSPWFHIGRCRANVVHLDIRQKWESGGCECTKVTRSTNSGRVKVWGNHAYLNTIVCWARTSGHTNDTRSGNLEPNILLKTRVQYFPNWRSNLARLWNWSWVLKVELKELERCWTKQGSQVLGGCQDKVDYQAYCGRPRYDHELWRVETGLDWSGLG
jgi:hypothetical protein